MVNPTGTFENHITLLNPPTIFPLNNQGKGNRIKLIAQLLSKGNAVNAAEYYRVIDFSGGEVFPKRDGVYTPSQRFGRGGMLSVARKFKRPGRVE